MQELITRLTEKAGISAEQATKAVDTIKDFVKEKFPMMSGAVDNLFANSASTSTSTAAAASQVKAEHGGSVLDKISDVIPGEAGEKAEAIAKNVADKAEDLFDSAKEKLGSFLGGDKK
jgi:hypothetical protein